MDLSGQIVSLWVLGMIETLGSSRQSTTEVCEVRSLLEYEHHCELDLSSEKHGEDGSPDCHWK